MNAETNDFEWLDLHGTVSAPELVRICGLSAADLQELLEYFSRGVRRCVCLTCVMLRTAPLSRFR